MDLNEVELTLKKILSEYIFADGTVNTEKIDSFEFIQLVLKIEDAFKIEFDDDLLTFDLLNDIEFLKSYVFAKMEEN
jgi:hypothetical protein